MIRIAVIFEKASDAIEYFKEVMTERTFENNVEVRIDGSDESMREFHELMTQTVVADMIEKVEGHLESQTGDKNDNN